jgi:hypothetical protein
MVVFAGRMTAGSAIIGTTCPDAAPPRTDHPPTDGPEDHP